MAQFYAFDFIYDDIPSHRYDLKIITFQNENVFSGVGSSDTTILSQKVLRKAKPYYLGRIQEPVLEFDLTFGTASPISGVERDSISQWLFGRSGYKKLYILQDDLNGAYFNCFMTAPKPLYIGGMNYAFTCTVTCDSPFAYMPSRTISGTTNGATPINIVVYNNSTEDEYLYPIVDFTIPATAPIYGVPEIPPGLYDPTLYQGNEFYIVNNTDNGRIFSFISLYPSMSVTIDNDLQIITLTGGENNIPPELSGITFGLANFNKNWFRLLPKANYLQIYSDANDDIPYEITLIERTKIGG